MCIFLTDKMFIAELAWNPCAYFGDAFFPHPIDCNKYFQCEHGKSRVQTCTGDLVYDKVATVCVDDRPDLECPEPMNAPAKPANYLSLLASTKPVIKKQTAPPEVTDNPVFPLEPENNSSVTSNVYPSRPGL